MKGEMSHMHDQIANLRQAFESKATRPVASRRYLLESLLNLLANHASEIEDALYSDIGKHRIESNLNEIIAVKNDIF